MSPPSPPRPGPSLARGSSRVSALADRAARAFAPQACLRGYAVFARGRVVVESLDDQAAALTVRGKRTRALEIRVAGHTLGVRCSCAPSSAPMSPCRHAWAALLELDRREAFPGLRSTRGPLLVATQAEVATEGESAAARAPRKRRPGRAPGRPKEAAPGARRRRR